MRILYAMIVIIDTEKGEAYNFKTRKDAGKFIGVSMPTLRGWLEHPFFLYRKFIITMTGNEKIEKSKKALYEVEFSRIRNRLLSQRPQAKN